MYTEIAELHSIYKEAFMPDKDKPVLGEYHPFGTQYRVYTMRGWVIVDTLNELDEELNKIESNNDERRKV